MNILDMSDSDPNEISIASQLYKEALSINDKFALSMSLGPITIHMISYSEKCDSLIILLDQAEAILRNSNEDGIPEYYKMTQKARILQLTSRDERADVCNRILEELNAQKYSENQYQKASRLFLTGVIHYLFISLTESSNYSEALPYWEEAWKLANGFPPAACKNFTANIYVMMSFIYREMGNSQKFIKVSEEYLRRMDRYFLRQEVLNRRPYIYKDNAYLICYQQLMLSHRLIGKAKAHEYYEKYCNFVKNGKGDPLLRNELYFFSISKQYYESLGDKNQALAFCDSIIHLIESGKALNMNYAVHYQSKARLLREMKRPEEACLVYDRAMYVTDSLVRKEQLEKIGKMRVDSEISELKLEKAILRSDIHRIALYCTIVLVIISISFSIYFYINLKRTRKLQQELLLHTLKAQESEQMKSAFIKSICQEVRTPLDNINTFTEQLADHSLSSEKKTEYSEIITDSCKELTSSLDHMLEAAYKESSS
ncbi:histidine kinase dimerization/phospho-acceptor domain-containing protein [Bacteroides sp.]